jgi:DNA polymerase-3 subunit gamma/tau
MLSSAAFNSLLKTLEEPPARVVFVLATTDPQRVLPTIISRCQRFDFRRIPLEAMVKHLHHIASQENINIAPDAVTLVAQVAQGGLRDAESLLDQLSLLAGEVTVERVWDLVGAVPERDLMALTKAIASDHPEDVLTQCRQLMDKGREPLVVLQNLAGFYRDLLIAKTAPNRSDLVAVTTPTWNKLCEFVEQLEIPDILQGQQHLKNSEAQIKNTTQPRLWLEVTLLGLLKSANSPQLQEGRSDRPLKREEPISTPPALAGQGGIRSPLPNTSSQTPAIASTSANNASTQPVSPKDPSLQEQVSNPLPPSPQGNHSESTPPSFQSAESIKASSNLEQVWQQVLTYLPLGSKALFSQHGYLLAFNTQQAQVGIRAPKLIKMAQPRLPDLELAFQKAYNQKIKVNLVVNQSSTAQTNSVEELPVSTSTPEASFSTGTPLAPVTEAKKDVMNEATTPSLSEISSPVSPQIIKQQELASVTSQPSRLPETEAAQTLPPQTLFVPDWNADEAEKALGNLKHFFEGEIIDLSDDFLEPEVAIAHQPQLEEAELAEGDRLSINISQATSDSPVVATLEASVIPLTPRLPKNQESTLAMQGTFEDSDSIEPVIVRQFPLSKMTSQDNSLNSLAQGDGEDEDDIPF